jgi:hypothetical protein
MNHNHTLVIFLLVSLVYQEVLASPETSTTTLVRVKRRGRKRGISRISSGQPMAIGIRSSQMQSSEKDPLKLLFGAAAGGLLASLLLKGLMGNGGAGGFGNDFPIITSITRLPFPDQG